MMMIRILVLLSSLLWLPTIAAAESMSPRVAQRLMIILDRSANDPQTALADLKSMAESRPRASSDRGYIIHERAVLLLQQDQPDVARSEIEQALAGQSEAYVPQLRILLAQLLLMEQELEAALLQLQIWESQVDSPRSSELALLGYTYLQLEQFEDAADILERTINLTETPQPQWIELLAFTYTRIGRTEEALALLENIISTQPEQARWWRQLANIYLLLDNIPKGAAGLTISSIVEELRFEDSRRLAGIFAALNMPADAATVLSTAMQEETQAADFENQMLLAELWVLARELDLAIEAFEAASKIEESGEPAMKMGQLYLQWEKYQEARDALTASIRAYGEDAPPQAHYLLAVTEINLGNLDAASNALIRLEDDDAYSERVENLIRYIQSQ